MRDGRGHGVIDPVPIPVCNEASCLLAREVLHRPGLNEPPQAPYDRTAGLVRSPAKEAAMPVNDQYRALLLLVAATAGLVGAAHLLARAVRIPGREPGKRIPFSAGRLAPRPVWSRYHVHYYGFALLFLAFDMEMAFMYPWAVVYRDLGLTALLDMGVFLSVLFLGLLYGWRMGALRRQ
jgi:NADH-quinone oxidoreductase subunit A